MWFNRISWVDTKPNLLSRFPVPDVGFNRWRLCQPFVQFMAFSFSLAYESNHRGSNRIRGEVGNVWEGDPARHVPYIYRSDVAERVALVCKKFVKTG